MRILTIPRFAALGAAFLLLLPACLQAQDEPTVLEAFIAEETALEDQATMLPSDVTTDSVFGGNLRLIDIPRAVTVLTPEKLEQFNIETFADLNKVGAGTQQYYDFGLPGSPYLRGWKAGTYFNGNLRAYQINELPMSFGSLERMEMVKGMAPAQYIPTTIGGFVNFVPKSPYFSEAGGSAEVGITSYGQASFQFDAGGPFLAGETPAAYRVSISGQQGEEWYKDVKNDYISIYASIKAELSDNLKAFTGGEFFLYDANEAPGWNRTTQELVDRNDYVIGEPISLISTEYGGRIDRDTLDFVNAIINFGAPGEFFGDAPMSEENLKGFNERAEVFAALAVPSSVVDDAVAGGLISAEQRSLLINMSDESVRADVYNGLSPTIARTTEGYVYTPDYVAAGGEIFTAPIEGDNILADPLDTAEADNFLYFLDFEWTGDPDFVVTNKSYFEYLETDKASYYGYAFASEQVVFNNRTQVEQKFDLGFENLFAYGVEYRYTDAEQKQDYWIEPFGRRDLTRPVISGNTRMPVGSETSPNSGVTYWVNAFDDPGFQGGNLASTLHQFGLFLSSQLDWSEMFSTFVNVRADSANWDTGVPDGLNVTFSNDGDGSDEYLSYGINQLIRINESLSLYGLYQEGTTYIPSGGGAIIGADAFADAELLEAGLKASFMEGRLFSSIAFFEWEQSGFNALTTDTEAYKAEGFEFELAWEISERLTMVGSITGQEVRNVSGGVPFGSRSYGFVNGANGDAEAGLALGGGLFVAFPLDEPPASNPDVEVPGAPEVVSKLFLVYEFDNGLGISGGGVWSDQYWGNYERTVKYPSSLVFNANLYYRGDIWDVRLSLENVTDEEYFFGGDPIVSASTLTTRAPDPTARLTVKYKF